MASPTITASVPSRFRQAVKYFAAFAGVFAALVLVLSYFFHTTSVEVVARVNDDVAQAIESGADITLELHDQPLGGILLESYEINADDVEIVEGNAIFQVSERTRSLPDNAHVQLCIDPDGDGHSNCATESVPTDGQPSDICLLYTSPSPRDQRGSRMPSSA